MAPDAWGAATKVARKAYADYKASEEPVDKLYEMALPSALASIRKTSGLRQKADSEQEKVLRLEETQARDSLRGALEGESPSATVSGIAQLLRRQTERVKSEIEELDRRIAEWVAKRDPSAEPIIKSLQETKRLLEDSAAQQAAQMTGLERIQKATISDVEKIARIRDAADSVASSSSDQVANHVKLAALEVKYYQSLERNVSDQEQRKIASIPKGQRTVQGEWEFSSVSRTEKNMIPIAGVVNFSGTLGTIDLTFQATQGGGVGSVFGKNTTLSEVRVKFDVDLSKGVWDSQGWAGLSQTTKDQPNPFCVGIEAYQEQEIGLGFNTGTGDKCIAPHVSGVKTSGVMVLRRKVVP